MVYNSGIIVMKKYFVILSVLVLAVFSSCRKDAGEPITREFGSGGSFTELKVCDGFDVIVCDAVSEITITAGENVMPKVVVEKKSGDELTIRLEAFTGHYKDLEMKVVMPYNADLRKVNLLGASSFTSSFALEGPEVEVELLGASEFSCDIDALEVDMDLYGASKVMSNVVAGEMDLDMTGSSEATLTGHVTKLDMDLLDASKIVRTVIGSEYGLAVDECEGTMLGASKAYIHSDGNIKVSLWGASDLHYTGNAATSESHTYGGSDIVHDVL